MKTRRRGSMRPWSARQRDAMAAYVRAILVTRDEGLFFTVTPILRKKRIIIEVSALTPALGRQAITQSLKRDVRFLGARGLQKVPVRHELGSTMAAMSDRLSRALALKALQPLDGRGFADRVVTTRRSGGSFFPSPPPRITVRLRKSCEYGFAISLLASAQPAG